jgi:hypothetical protein
MAWPLETSTGVPGRPCKSPLRVAVGSPAAGHLGAPPAEMTGRQLRAIAC